VTNNSVDLAYGGLKPKRDPVVWELFPANMAKLISQTHFRKSSKNHVNIIGLLGKCRRNTNQDIQMYARKQTHDFTSQDLVR
jgi:hypothetical protein